MDAKALGASFNLNMKCWETLLPHVVRHPLIRLDLMALLKAYQQQYPGAMFSGCGGGYLIVVSDKAGARRVQGQCPCSPKNKIMKTSAKIFHRVAALALSAHGRRSAQTNSIAGVDLPPIADGPFKAGLEFADKLPDARMVPRRQVRHLGALGAAMRAGARRLVCAQHVYAGPGRL